ncbi:LOW QUALITY PROTEIN: hypothetical protein HMPREF0005_05803, partial [Achromobacter xylosoxidans C54]
RHPARQPDRRPGPPRDPARRDRTGQAGAPARPRHRSRRRRPGAAAPTRRPGL